MLKKITELIKKANKIAISSHIRPDADSIGSGLALYLMLKQLGKEVHFYNKDKPSLNLMQLPGYEVIKYRQIYPETFDILLLIEGSTETRIGQNHLDKYFTINIDHHSTNPCNSNINWVVPEAGAVGELIYEIGKELNVTFTRAIAFNIYTAIVSDTGSFSNSNSTYRSLHIASELLKIGNFSVEEVCDLLYSNHIEKVKMLQKILSTLRLKLGNRVSIIEFHRNFIKKLSLKEIETEDIIAIVRSIKGVEVTLFFKEISNGHYRVSIRGKGNFNCQKVAEVFDGGGHLHAAGFFLRGNLKKVEKVTLKVIEEKLKEENCGISPG